MSAAAPKLAVVMPPALVGIAEVCRILGCSDDTVRRLVKAGELPYIRLTPGGPLRFTLADIEKFIQRKRA